MNNKQRLVLVFCALITILMVLFPPWKYRMYISSSDVPDEFPVKEKWHTGRNSYRFIGSPPTISGTGIDFERLLVQFGALVFITGILYLAAMTEPTDSKPTDDRE